MNKQILISLLLALSNLVIAQDHQEQLNLSPYGIGIMGGINRADFTGTSFLIEGRMNLIPNLNSKLSIGYSTLYEKDGSHINTHGNIDLDEAHRYPTVSYDIHRFRYSTIPISLGLEYIFTRRAFTPYSSFELGYNFYEFKREDKNHHIGRDGYYNNFDDLPNKYKNKPPKTAKENSSYRIAFGVGTLYKLSSMIFLDLRYVYQINTSLVNGHQFLVGIQL